jgi:hypothetical protein
LVGLLLGDLCASKHKLGVNPILRFEQGLVHKDYIFHLYELFKDYCMAVPKISNMLPDKRTGKIYTRVQFHTRALPCFVAYWIADDGTFNKLYRCVILCTNSVKNNV